MGGKKKTLKDILDELERPADLAGGESFLPQKLRSAVRKCSNKEYARFLPLILDIIFGPKPDTSGRIMDDWGEVKELMIECEDEKEDEDLEALEFTPADFDELFQKKYLLSSEYKLSFFEKIAETMRFYPVSDTVISELKDEVEKRTSTYFVEYSKGHFVKQDPDARLIIDVVRVFCDLVRERYELTITEDEAKEKIHAMLDSRQIEPREGDVEEIIENTMPVYIRLYRFMSQKQVDKKIDVYLSDRNSD